MAGAVIAACATGTTPTSDRRGAAVDAAPVATFWATREAISSAHLSELRFPDWPEHRDAVERFYADRGFTPAWLRKGRPTQSALAVIDLLERAGGAGLAGEDYDAGRWAERVKGLRDRRRSESDRARFDLALTVCAVRYASDLHRGRIDPRSVGFELGSGDPDRSFDPATVVQKLAAGSDIEEVVTSLQPHHPEYRRLLNILDRYRELAGAEEAAPPAPFVADDVIRPGDSYVDLPRLVDLLSRLGDLRGAQPVGREEAPDADEDLMRYQGDVVEAIERFQRRHGLEPDGKIGKATLGQLSTPLARRVRQIELALERWRWRPARWRDPTDGAGLGPAIVVNVPEFRLRGFDGAGQVAFTSAVAVGKAGRHETPVFAERMRTVVFRPGWYVPASITRREIVPEMEKDPSHLSREGYEILGAAGEDASSARTLVDLRRGALRLRQKPGPENALGPVKFLFPNPWNVYLHGTPSTRGFLRARRDLSHGCIRVADPIGLAVWLLRDQPEWDRDRILATVSGPEDEVAVTLDASIPVHVVYDTVVASEEGEVLFFDDLYGHDARLERALERRGVSGSTSGERGRRRRG